MVVRWERGDLVLAGEFDLANQDLVREAVVAAVAQGVDRLTVDMTDVAFCDRRALGVIVAAAQLGLQVTVRRPPSIVVRLMRLTGADQHVTIEH